MLTDPAILYLVIMLAPLASALIIVAAGQWLGNSFTHWVANLGVALSCVLSMLVYHAIIIDGQEPYHADLYVWLSSGGIDFKLGLLIDSLTVTMMVVVTFISWMVHLYTIGYMAEDPGYQRFFIYILLFTFAMLVLVMANNFIQLFFGWEAVGLMSYLLIGFWFKRESAIFANLKAFLVNRVGDFGFLIGIAAIFMVFDSLDYATVFARAPELVGQTIELIPSYTWSLATFICLCLFIGAMGKSAQVPLHVWLPDSMEGPTPISALIHAATMVTAGIFMVARMSPLFELSATALNCILIIGGATALLMGLLGIVQNDIKRVVAYSTLSQLGYMTVALGASAYAAAIFHLFTHAFFKALLFLAAGSVIVAMHHEQDMRKMGGLYKSLPITWVTCLIGTLALIGFPGSAGFFSKDAIINAVHISHLPAAKFAYYALLSGVFVTALYSFRMFFLTFHGESKLSKEIWLKTHESPYVITLPLCLLAIASLFGGMFMFSDMLFANYFGSAIYVLPAHDVLARLPAEQHELIGFVTHAFAHPTVLVLMFAGVACAWLLYIKQTKWPAVIATRCHWLYSMLLHKYGIDTFYQTVFAGGTLGLGRFLWQSVDVRLIDNGIVNGVAAIVQRIAQCIRHMQSGYLYHYAFVMILGLLLLTFAFVHGQSLF